MDLETVTLGNNCNFNERVYKYVQPKLIEEIERVLKSVDFTFVRNSTKTTHNQKNLFTLIVTVHDVSEKYYVECIESIQNQTYQELEIIIIEHGTNALIKNYNRCLIANDPRFKAMSIVDNNLDNYFHLINAALFFSSGDYYYFIAYDDKLSNNYAEKMVKLFIERKDCVSAAPLPVSIDKHGVVNHETSQIFRATNQRLRFTSGLDLAYSFINKEDKIAFPGGILAHKTVNVLARGGVDKENDISQLFKFAVYGISGFDSSALLYWRHHELQTNKELTRKATLRYKSQGKYYSDLSKVLEKNLDLNISKKVLDFSEYHQQKDLTGTMVRLVESGNLLMLFKYILLMLKEVPINKVILTFVILGKILLKKLRNKLVKILIV